MCQQQGREPTTAGTPETVESSVMEESSAAVGTPATADSPASRDPRDETTALRKQQQQDWQQHKRQQEHHVTPNNSRDVRISRKPNKKWVVDNSKKQHVR